ncbi:MAG: dihydrodipicolinate synthetase [Acidimicrobiaceae bacterium]|jgi:dihydrodipicolinate synthase/N-acetylneuraminate lyase|nr:dihydrodipicolinate synthetase [Acidimicrobiaceae bacterium]
MEPLTSKDLRGTWATVLLPLNRDNSIDLERLDEELASLTSSPVDGIYTNGTAGEFHAIGEDEYDEVSALVARRCSAMGKPFQIGASHMSGDTSLGRIRRAHGLSPSGFQIILPDWCPLSDDEVVAAVEGLAEAADPLPMTLYNPPHAKTRVAPELFGRLTEHVPQLIGIKVAGGDAAWYRAMDEYAPGLAIFVPGHLLATGVRLGAAGSYSNVACLSPAGAVAWHAMMTESPDAAADLERRINAFLDVHIMPLKKQGFADAALDKTLAHIGGWAPVGTRTRWPFRCVDEELAESLRPVARREMPELFGESSE